MVAALRVFIVAPAHLLHGMWDVIYLTRDRTHILCIARLLLNWNPPNWKLSLRADTVCCVRLSGGKSAIFGANFDFPVVIVPRSVQETSLILSELHRALGKNL